MTEDPSIMTSGLLRVLVVDARVGVNESLVGLLSEFEDVTVFGCSQGPDKVLALSATIHSDVVILDLESEGSIDLKTVKLIKDFPEAPVIIVLSHYYLGPIPQSARAAGADHFIVKTTECGRLQGLLHDLVLEKKACSPGGRLTSIDSMGVL